MLGVEQHPALRTAVGRLEKELVGTFPIRRVHDALAVGRPHRVDVGIGVPREHGLPTGRELQQVDVRKQSSTERDPPTIG